MSVLCQSVLLVVHMCPVYCCRVFFSCFVAPKTSWRFICVTFQTWCLSVEQRFPAIYIISRVNLAVIRRKKKQWYISKSKSIKDYRSKVVGNDVIIQLYLRIQFKPWKYKYEDAWWTFKIVQGYKRALYLLNDAIKPHTIDGHFRLRVLLERGKKNLIINRILWSHHFLGDHFCCILFILFIICSR